MSIARMRNHQCLHCHAIFFHQISNTWITIDHNLISKPHLAARVTTFDIQKLFAKRPVMITNGHAH